MMSNPLSALPVFTKWLLIVGIGLILLIILWAAFLGGWNKIGNAVFQHQIDAKQQEVDKAKAEIYEKNKALQQTLLELKQAKEDYAKIKEQSDAAQKIFFDQSKTSAEKVAEFKKTLDAAHAHTSTDNITTDDLCTRAKAAGSSAELITALCSQ